ncbi:MAG: hypothetical protein E2604_16995 [Flavobacterium sp.]|nr:hypothetical protein [Flavobacterium sp.]
MKTENTSYPITHLIPMTDFVLLRSKEPVLKDCPGEIRIIHRYAEFLKQPLKLEMFIPDDEFGFDKVLFRGFKVEETSHGLDIYGHGVSVRFAIEKRSAISSFCMHELPLTDTALNQIFVHASH